MPAVDSMTPTPPEAIEAALAAERLSIQAVIEAAGALSIAADGIESLRTERAALLEALRSLFTAREAFINIARAGAASTKGRG